MAEPAYYEMPSIVLGDTWGGLTSISINPSGSYFPNNAASALMQFRKEKRRGGVPLHELSTANSGIVMLNPTGWSFYIPPVNLNLLPGTIYWDFQVTDVSGYKKTYLEGVLPVVQDVSR